VLDKGVLRNDELYGIPLVRLHKFCLCYRVFGRPTNDRDAGDVTVLIEGLPRFAGGCTMEYGRRGTPVGREAGEGANAQASG
jgi:hypothetical protein